MSHPADSHIRRLVAEGMAAQATLRLGEVTSFDPNTYTAKVTIQPDQIETGWLPIASQMVGTGWGLFTPPSPGDQAIIAFEAGFVEGGLIVGFLYSDKQRPITTVKAGEFWLQHATGSLVKLTADGKVAITANTDLNITVNGNATLAVTGNITSSAAAWAHTGDLAVTGNINSTKTITATTDVVGAGKSLKTHVHTGVTAGGAVSGPPQ